MSDENIFFLPVGKFCQRELITCRLDDRVQDLALTMRENNVSSIIVCEDQEPIGIVTDRDLRNKVVSVGADAQLLRARDIMNMPLITVKSDDHLFEVVFQMSRHNIHRVGVTEADGRLCGIVNESDLLRIQTRSPQRLLHNLDMANTLVDLKAIHAEIEKMVAFLSRSGVPTKDLVRLISSLNDRIVKRLIKILQRDRFPNLPKQFVFIVLGSEGRSEQTLKTDQDNAIILGDDLTGPELTQVEAFSKALIDGLIEIGVPECPGGIMAKNEFWRRSLSEWIAAVDKWISTPTSENILNFSMFADVRALWGDTSLVDELKRTIIRRAAEEEIFMARMAANVVRFEPPLGFFGGFKVEKDGAHQGEIDLKKAGIFAITEGVKVLFLEAGLLGGCTRDKIALLKERGVLPAEQADDLDAAFSLLVFFRLRCQVRAIEAGREPSNFIDPARLNRLESSRLHTSLEVVKSFENLLKSHFRLNMLRN